MSIGALTIALAIPLGAQSGGRGPKVRSVSDSSPDWMWRFEQPTGCLASIRPAVMHNVPVYLAADMTPITDSLLTLQADLMAQDVAIAFRDLLDSNRAVMPNADAKLVWYSVPAQIVVIAYVDGNATWRAKGIGGDATALQLLGAAFDSTRAHGLGRMFWASTLTTDSVIVRLSLRSEYVGHDPSDDTERRRVTRFGVFYLSEPELTPALPKLGWPPPRYPSYNEQHRVQGNLIMRFAVDTTGRAIASTIRDLWPADKPRLTGELGRYYDEFVASVTSWIPQIGFYPARLGGCPVKQFVQLPLKFVAPNSR
jgi:hypothetical protein